MTTRDRNLLTIVGVVGAIAAFWFLMLSPKLADLDDAKKQTTEAKSSYEKSRSDAQQFAQARLDFPSAYSNMVRLGKAVPTQIDEASLVYQLDQAADRAGVEFTKLELSTTSASSGPAPAPAPAATATASAGATGGAGASATATAPPSDGSELLGSTPANATAVATAPAGSATGQANLRVMHFDFDFTGPFFRLEEFLGAVKRLTRGSGSELAVSGRLITIDAIHFGDQGREISIAATAFLIPAGQGLLAGATAAGPAGVAEGTPQTASSSSTAPAPPTATVREP